MNEQILEKAAKSFGTELSDLKYVGGFQNFVYEYTKLGNPYILRITYSSHRSADQVNGELEWVLYLDQHGVSVSKPILSCSGSYVEIVNLEGSYFVIASFEKAPGSKIFYPECMNNDTLSEMCGEITGRIHELSRRYVPSRQKFKRHEWTENSYLKNIKRFIPSDQERVIEQYEQLVSEIHLLKKEHTYGLIHGDINVGNFHVDDQKLTLFDFDECQYSWYEEDIAVQLFYIVYVVLNDSIPEREEQARRFLEYFLKGYQRHTVMSEVSLCNLSLFLRLREFIVYIGMHRSFDFSQLNDWTSTYLKESRDRLEQGVSIVEDFL
ncbi:phosphotransferase enzyme family protein [Paenibacillus lemnae]|nr:phosphotransferase [Paenibacillus lemnae]